MTVLRKPRFGKIPSLLIHTHARDFIKTVFMSFGKAECLGKSALDVTLDSLKYSDMKRKKKKKKARNLISDFQSESTSGIVFHGTTD